MLGTYMQRMHNYNLEIRIVAPLVARNYLININSINLVYIQQ